MYLSRYSMIGVAQLSVVAVATMLASSASAQMRIVGARELSGTKFVVDTNQTTTKVKTKVTVKAGTQTLLASYALINEGTCTYDGEGAWTLLTKPKNGTTATGTVTGHLADGKCPKKKFKFAAIAYTSTTAGAKSDKFVGQWSDTYQGTTYAVNDTFLITITP